MMLRRSILIQIVFALLLLGFALGAILFLEHRIPCKNVITYRLGALDSRFGIEVSQVKTLLSQAEGQWETLAGRELFQYDQAQGDVVVNFIFDERQERTQAEQRLDQAEDALGLEQERIGSSYESLSKDFEQRASRYDARVKQFEGDLTSYNEEVDRLNRTGRATEEDVKRLERESKRLEQEGQALEGERQSINQLVERINTLASKEEKLISGYNEKVEDFQERFQEEGLFDQGEYGARELNIYQFKTEADLRLVLIHELGHTLGLDHVENPQSIMYYLMEEQDAARPIFTKEDQQAFQAICASEGGFTYGNVQEIFSFLVLRFNQVRASYETQTSS